MRKSIAIAVVAFIAGAASTWTLSHGGGNARYQISGALQQGINTLELTKLTRDLPVQQYDAH